MISLSKSNELLNLFVVRNSAENLYKEISSISDCREKDQLLTMSVQDLINLHAHKINSCDSKIKLELVKTSLEKEVKKLNTDKFYLSASMIEKNSGHIQFDAGDNFSDFDEDKLLKNLENINYFDFQGSHWAPHLIHKSLWNEVGGFCEEFYPGTGSDPDLNMKLWKKGVRIFKGLNKFV